MRLEFYPDSSVREYIIPRGGYPDVQGGDVITGLYKRTRLYSAIRTAHSHIVEP